MRTFTAIADDLTGACDVAAELATAGQRVRVVIEPGATLACEDGGIVIVNTQSRSLDAASACARVHHALLARPTSVVLKKIDTALRGHLGAEIDGALAALAGPCFILAAIPAAGRVTRDGCQWFGDRLLSDTEFAWDPEGPGAVSSIAEVLGRESRRRVAVLPRAVTRTGEFAAEVARQRSDGVDVFVVDAESDDDIAIAVAAILGLAGPVCLAGSIALTAALAPYVGGEAVLTDGRERERSLPLPALIVSGSLHSRARAQVDAVLATGLAVALPLPEGGPKGIAALATMACARLSAGMSVVLTPAPPIVVPASEALRATEGLLAEVVGAISGGMTIPALVLIGGETSCAVLTRLGAGTIEVHGRVAPLIARGVIGRGPAVGTVLITKGGSGGDPDVIADLIVAGIQGRRRTAEARS